jgi:hypothetical protein
VAAGSGTSHCSHIPPMPSLTHRLRWCPLFGNPGAPGHQQRTGRPWKCQPRGTHRATARPVDAPPPRHGRGRNPLDHSVLPRLSDTSRHRSAHHTANPTGLADRLPEAFWRTLARLTEIQCENTSIEFPDIMGSALVPYSTSHEIRISLRQGHVTPRSTGRKNVVSVNPLTARDTAEIEPFLCKCQEA